jgi:NADP-dependent aldehyde dehydrogenase
MGWCQGRICGYATAGIAACLGGRTATAADLRPLSGRTPAVPVRLGELAALAGDPAAPRATGGPHHTHETTDRDGE